MTIFFSFAFCYQWITLATNALIFSLVDSCSFVDWLTTTTATATMGLLDATLLNAFEMHRHRETLDCRSKTCVAERKNQHSVVNSCDAADTCRNCAVNFDLHVDLFDWAVSPCSNAANLDISSDSYGWAANSGFEAWNTAMNLDLNVDSSYHQKCANWNFDSARSKFSRFWNEILWHNSFTFNVNYNWLKFK